MAKRSAVSGWKVRVAGSIPSVDIYFHFEFSLVLVPYSPLEPLQMKSSMIIHLVYPSYDLTYKCTWPLYIYYLSIALIRKAENDLLFQNMNHAGLQGEHYSLLGIINYFETFSSA